MINYIITSVSLSLIGWLIYMLLVRKKASVAQRKSFIYFSLAGSLLLPLTVQHSAPILKPTAKVTPLQFGMPIDQQHLQQYCRCQNPDYSHRIKYRTNAYYNFLLSHKSWLANGIFIAISLVLLTFFAQLMYLRYLVRKSEREEWEIEGMRFLLLKTPKNHGVGAFQLINRYIIWQDEMELLTDREMDAILRHELSHLRQYNTFEKAALRIIQCFWFINPVFYFFRKELDLLSECLADEKGSQMMENRKAYAQLLLKLKSLQSLSLVQPFKGSSLRRRIEYLVGKSNNTSRNKTAFYFGFMLLISLQVFMVSPLSAQVDQTIRELETYEQIYHKVDPGENEAVYCQDCETVCTPEME